MKDGEIWSWKAWYAIFISCYWEPFMLREFYHLLKSYYVIGFLKYLSATQCLFLNVFVICSIDGRVFGLGLQGLLSMCDLCFYFIESSNVIYRFYKWYLDNSNNCIFDNLLECFAIGKKKISVLTTLFFLATEFHLGWVKVAVLFILKYLVFIIIFFF